MHAIPVRPSHRRIVRTFTLVAALLACAGVARATGGGISDAAAVSVTAERIVVTGEGLFFPIEPVPRCDVLDNFGGDSKAFGSGSHQGVDIGAARGQAVYAVEDGVLYRRWTSGNPGLGWGLWSDTDVKYRYFHLDRFADGLDVGARVYAGQVIGYVGDTGNASPGGWHLHFEVRPGPDHQPVDPVPLLDIPSPCRRL